MSELKFKCDNCNDKFRYKCHLDWHLWIKHDINPNNKYKMHKCDHCAFESKNIRSLNRHVRNIHRVGKYKIHRCNYCTYESTEKGNLKEHLFTQHDIGCGQIYKCDHCDFKTKYNRSLKTHLYTQHNIGNGKIYTCEYCTYETKTKGHLMRHYELVHDLGDKVCGYCQGNCFRIRSYKDKNVGKVVVCNKCYKKVTGYKCRAEEDMIKFIENHDILQNFIVSMNKIIKHDSCNTKRRPDILLSSGDLHIVIECDEKQHQHYSPICESGRIDEILDEFKNGKVVFIRWNPDHYKVYKSVKKLNRAERLNRLGVTVMNIIDNQPKEHIKVVYMFYNKDNPVIVNRWNKEFIY